MEMVIKDNFVKAKYASAENRFSQGNVKASYSDFKDLIARATHDDYVFLSYAMRMAEFGFFDLSDELINKLDSNLYTENYVRDIKKYYYPSALVNVKDTLALADAYASIVYNNLAIETTSELINSVKLTDSDYKNYLISLGLSFFVPRMYTAIAFDSGGVASGPLTSTFILPFAIGACMALGGNVLSNAFGVVAMVAMTPLITIQLLGFSAVIKKQVRERIAMRRILDEDDGQIIDFM